MKEVPRVASRLAAGIGALAIGLVGFAGTASADLGAGNINPDTKGSLTLHKQESGSQTSGPGSVTGNPNPGGTPVAGAEFALYKVEGLNLTTQAAWEGLDGATVNADCSQLTVGGKNYTTTVVGTPQTTMADGSATFSNLDVAGYTVCETKSPDNVQKKAAPFFVTVPFPNGTSGWLYNVHAYPKNTVVQAPTKGITVTANGLQTADQVSFPVTVTVPSIATEDKFQYFIVSDDLDSNLVDGKVVSVMMDGAAVNTAYYTATDGDPVSVGFNQTGLDWLKTQPNKQITVTFAAKVNGVPTDGVIPNTAQFYVNVIPGNTPPDTPPVTPPDTPPTPPTPTNKVIQTWGAAQIIKQDKDNAAKLSGAAFQVYNAVDPYAVDCSTAVRTGNPITVNGADTFTTAGDGTVTIPGLFVDEEIGAAGVANVTPDHTQRCYVLVETAAPAGYNMLTQDTPLTVVAGNVATASSVTIDNTKQDVPGLPLTGGSGQVVMLTGGAVMIAAAGALVLARRRRVEA